MKCSTGSTRFPICLWDICWHGTSATKRIWLTSFSIPVKRDSPGFCYCWLISAREGKAETVIPKMSQETLAEMIGTTRSRVSFFMNRFRKLGFIDYHAGDELQVHSSLLNIILHD